MSDQGSYWSDKEIRRIEVNVFAKECMQNYLSGSESILDLGCGRGADSLYFAENGCAVTALDVSSVNIQYVQELAAANPKLHLIVRQGDIVEPLPYDNHQFDAVYAHLSIHYFDDATTRSIVTEVKRVLKPGGLFFVKCKSVEDPLYGKGECMGKNMYKADHEHVRHFFSEDYMRECLDAFDILSLEKTRSTYLEYESAFIEAVARTPSL